MVIIAKYQFFFAPRKSLAVDKPLVWDFRPICQIKCRVAPSGSRQAGATTKRECAYQAIATMERNSSGTPAVDDKLSILLRGVKEENAPVSCPDVRSLNL